MAQNKDSASDSIRILSVVWFNVFPAHYGGQKGSALFNLYLSQLANLACICSRNNSVEQQPYKIYPSLPVSKSQFVNPVSWWKIYVVAKKERSTHIILEYPYYGIAGYLCKKFLGTNLVVHSHNVEYARFKQQHKWWWRVLYFYERWTLRKADLVLIKTETEKEQLISKMHIPANKIVVTPYGIKPVKTYDKEKSKISICTTHHIPITTKILLFAGTLDYLPNAKAVEDIYHIVAPALQEKEPGIRIIICGRNRYKSFGYLDKLKHPLVIHAGEVENINDYFAAADVLLNPITNATGMQTKIMDALSFDLKVVCFESLTAGVPKSANLFIAPVNNWEVFIKQIEKALVSPIIKAESWKESYRWSTIAGNTLNALLHC